MATILLTWELGSGLGHIMPLQTLGQALIARGHRVIAAIRDLSGVPEGFKATGIEVLQAPALKRYKRSAVEFQDGYADILANVGFADEQALDSMFVSWNEIADQTGADLVVMDFSPFALLALYGRKLRQMNLGFAYCSPPKAASLPTWLRVLNAQGLKRIARLETFLLEKANNVLKKHRRPMLARMSDLFHAVDEVILTSIPELDPYGKRRGAQYWGPLEPSGGEPPQWPDGNGPKVFAYVKSFAALPAVLKELQRQACPTLVYASGLKHDFLQGFACSTLAIEERPLAIRTVARECNLGISNGGHGVVSSMLLAGKPTLNFPLFGEQEMNARTIARINAGRSLPHLAIKQVKDVLSEMLSSDMYRLSAQAISLIHRDLDPAGQRRSLAEKVESLISKRTTTIETVNNT